MRILARKYKKKFWRKKILFKSSNVEREKKMLDQENIGNDYVQVTFFEGGRGNTYFFEHLLHSGIVNQSVSPYLYQGWSWHPEVLFHSNSGYSKE